MTLKSMFDQLARYPRGMKVRLWLPRWLMRPQLWLAEPLQRALGLPAFLSRDTVDASRGHLCYSSAKAQRALGWTHPGADDMWDNIIRREQALVAKRRGFFNKLRHQSVVNDETNIAPSH